ncbi:MAG: P63C domain-containing protein [Chitinophagaceae bacterium]
MAKEKLLKATHEGLLQLGNADLEVAVLENGQRIIGYNAVFKALDRPSRGNSRMIGVPAFMDAQNLQPFIDEGLRGVISKVDYTDKNGKVQAGFDANILPLVSDLYLKAREAGAITLTTQLETAKKAEILVRSLAKVAISALIDEATGYQYVREKDELQKILRAYIAEELLPWQKRFPDVFYKELFRLNGWDYTVNGIKRRPGVIGTWTNKLVYEQLPDGVLEELKAKTPKSQSGNYTARFFQSLTADTGDPHLTAQIQQVVTLFQLSDNMQHMWSQFEKLKIRQSGQLELPFQFDDSGHTKEPHYEPNKLSGFNNKLRKALDYNPKKEGEDEKIKPSAKNPKSKPSE